jgi:hypothetical protein
LAGAVPGTLQPFGHTTRCCGADADRFVLRDGTSEQALDCGLLVRG